MMDEQQVCPVRPMKWSTFALACALVMALFLFAQRRTAPTEHPMFTRVLDLTHNVSDKVPTFDDSEKFKARTVGDYATAGYFARDISLPEHFGTHIDAPAHFLRGMWTVDQIPTDRLLRPLVVLDVTRKVSQDPDYRIAVDDVAAWEQEHGPMPESPIVIAHTGWDERWNSPARYRNTDANGVYHFPGYSLEAAKFLVEGRGAVALGIDTLSVDYGPSKDFVVHHYTPSRSVYHLENVANLDKVPASGAFLLVAPMKLEGGSGGPVRILALVK